MTVTNRKTAKDPQIVRAIKLLRSRLREFMRKKGLETQDELADMLSMSRQTLGPYLWPKSGVLPTPDTMERIRKVVDTISDEDATLIGKAYSRRRSLGGAGGTDEEVSASLPSAVSVSSAPTAKVPARPSGQVGDAEIGRLVRQLFQAIAGNGAATVGFNPVEYLLQQAQTRYNVGDKIAVPTEKNFTSVDVSAWTEADWNAFLAYTTLSLEEARKCMLILAQFKSDEARQHTLKHIGQNADLLWRAFQLASAVVPMLHVKDIDLQHLCDKTKLTS